ncbi:MAG: UTP--glucose-1-phosphate uridylyltransferase GalU [Verrucomicrobiaceae bacterium]|nr:UTP--glucose-1-phosphate uridylyltransferase GalU [Verrucomicrobiaceae bacterium]
MPKVTKAVIPAAGFGTRFLPATKSQPKEMLPIVDTPTIQYVVEEAARSGITDILMIIGKSKRAIEEHFSRNIELETELSEKAKVDELEQIRGISNLVNLHFVWQKELNGLGDAVSYARYHVGSEPFVLMLGDTLMGSDYNRRPITRQMLDAFEKHNGPIVAVEEVPHDKVERYGIIGGDLIEPDLYKLDTLIEKPHREEAPSNLAIAGRYIFTAEIFDYIDSTPPGKNGEIQLTDAMARMLKGHDMYALNFHGTRYDIGNKLDFLKTNVVFGLEREDLGTEFREFIISTADQLREGR